VGGETEEAPFVRGAESPLGSAIVCSVDEVVLERISV
jgi:hypothetical protein